VEAFGSTVYKVETVGPVYVVSAGVPEPHIEHCKALALLALKMRKELDETLLEHQVGRCRLTLSNPF
jgi:hypothetical protein